MKITPQRPSQAIAESREQQGPEDRRDGVERGETRLRNIGGADRDRTDRGKPVEEAEAQDEGDRMSLECVERPFGCWPFEHRLNPRMIPEMAPKQEEALVGGKGTQGAGN